VPVADLPVFFGTWVSLRSINLSNYYHIKNRNLPTAGNSDIPFSTPSFFILNAPKRLKNNDFLFFILENQHKPPKMSYFCGL
jgi:hypothetical protein